MNCEKAKKLIDGYNWDDGFELPQKIINSSECDMALALEIFYLADGYAFFQETKHTSRGSTVWREFLQRLYDDIKRGKYYKADRHYEIPLTRTQKYILRKKGIPEVFLEDV